MQIISTDKGAAPKAPYSQGIVSGDFIFTAGQVALDPATGASEVNQLNRIKLMMAVAFENLKKDEYFDSIVPEQGKPLKAKEKAVK